MFESHFDLAALARECIHCGLCLESCPTYALTKAEPDSPRGRIHLMKALIEGEVDPAKLTYGALDRCLGCRACESACPSGVPYGHLLEAVRARFVLPHRAPDARRRAWLVMRDHLLTHPIRLRAALGPLSGARRWLPRGLERGSRMLPSMLRRAVEMVDPPGTELPLPEFSPAVGPRQGTVALLTGCVMDALYRRVHHATLRVLRRAGYDVWIPRQQACCGALHRHDGDFARAAELLRVNLRAFARPGVVAIVTNSAGCGAAMKDYGTWLPPGDPDREAAIAFSRQVRDVTEFLASVDLPRPDRPIPLKAAYHEPCHLAHGQKIREAPRALLAMIPELELVTLAESDWCCGGAGSYAMLEAEKSERLQARKLKHLQASGADLLVTANPSCLMQLGDGLRRYRMRPELLHLVELLDRAYTV